MDKVKEYIISQIKSLKLTEDEVKLLFHSILNEIWVKDNIKLRYFIEKNLRFYDKNEKEFKLREEFLQLAEYIEKCIDTKEVKNIIIFKPRNIGASTFTAILGLGLTQVRSDFDCLFLVPDLNIANHLSLKLNEIISGAILGEVPKRRGGFKTVIEENIMWKNGCDRKFFKKFNNKSSYFISSGNLINAIRGRKADFIVLDEGSLFNEDSLKVFNNFNGLNLHVVTKGGNITSNYYSKNNFTENILSEGVKEHSFIDGKWKVTSSDLKDGKNRTIIYNFDHLK